MKEEHVGPNAFKVHRGYALGNPYTHIKDKKTKDNVIYYLFNYEFGVIEYE